MDKATSILSRLMFFSVFALALLALFSVQADANEDFKLNTFPTQGKPLYAVIEFNSFVPDPTKVALASASEYKKLGADRLAFLDTVLIRKLSASRYAISTQSPIDEPNFVVALDVTYKTTRRIYPIQMSAGQGQANIIVGSAVEYAVKSRTADPKPATAKVEPAPQSQIKTEVQPPVVLTISAPDKQETQLQITNETKETQMQTVQPQVLYAQAPMVAQNSANSETLPFYVMAIVLIVLVVLVVLAVALFFHLGNSKQTHQPIKEHESQDNGLKHLIQMLPSLIGGQQQHNQMRQQLPALPFNDSDRYLPHLEGGHHQPTFGQQQRATAPYGSQAPAHVPAHVPAQYQPAPAPVQQPEVSEEPAVSQPVLEAPQAESTQHVRSTPAALVEPPKPRTVPQRPVAPEQKQAQPVVRKPAAAPVASQAKPVPAARAAQPTAAPVAKPTPAPQRPNPAPAAQAPQPTANVQPAAPVQRAEAPTANPVQPVQKASVNAAQKPPIAEPPKPSAAVTKSEKLQLAVVYMNMGDEMMARMLLDELMRDGSDFEKAEAAHILAKLANNAPSVPFVAETSDEPKGH